LKQQRGRRTGAAGMGVDGGIRIRISFLGTARAGSARRGRRERGRERERATGRPVHQKSVYVYTIVLYSSRDSMAEIRLTGKR
jgi:hypothetical protein